MRTLALASTLLAGCHVVFGVPELPPLADAPRPVLIDALVYHQTFTVTPPDATRLDEFPVSFVISDSDLSSHAMTDGSNIAFFTEAGDPLPFEIAYYEPESGHLEAWVRMTLEGPTKIVLAYGGGTTDTSPPVWGAYTSVYHFARLEAGTVIDSTGNQELGQAIPTKWPAISFGLIGAAAKFANSAASENRQSVCATGTFAVESSFAFSAWVNAAPSLVDETPIAAGLASDGFALERSTVQPGWHGRAGDVRVDAGVPVEGTWQHVAIIVDRNATLLSAYVDNVLESAVALAGPPVAPTSFCFGGVNGFTGLVDEVRIYASAPSTAWLTAEYENIVHRETFITPD